MDQDSDGDGILDVVEAQTSAGYTAPTGSVGANGLYDIYESDDTVFATGQSFVLTPQPPCIDTIVRNLAKVENCKLCIRTYLHLAVTTPFTKFVSKMVSHAITVNEVALNVLTKMRTYTLLKTYV